MLKRVGLLLALAIGPGPEFLSARAQEQAAITNQNDAAFGAEIQGLTREADWQGALQLLDSRPDLGRRPDVIRLRAGLLHQLGRSTEALLLLEGYLTTAPNDALARFQLGEIYFSKRQDQAAAKAYRLALSGSLDPLRQQAIALRLAEMQARRKWRFWAGGSIAPDSNINSATDASRVDLFGLPFELNDAARRQSGVALSLFGGAERSIIYAEDQAIRLSILGSVMDAPGAQLDTASLSLRGGPEWRLLGDTDISLQATLSERWFGGDVLDVRDGFYVGAEFGQPRTRWTGALSLERVDDKLSNERDGWSGGVDLARTHYLSPSRLWRLGLSFWRREAEVDPESYVEARVSAGVLLPLPLAATLYVEPYIDGRHHDAAAFAFGVVRDDLEEGITARLSKRDWLIAGGFPYIAAGYSHSDSSVAIGAFSRWRMEFGLTREF